jgi:hypothetical protein
MSLRKKEVSPERSSGAMTVFRIFIQHTFFEKIMKEGIMKLAGKRIWSLLCTFIAIFLPIGGGAAQKEMNQPSAESKKESKLLLQTPQTVKGPILRDATKIIFSPVEGKSIGFPAGGMWTYMQDTTFQQIDSDGNKLIIKQDGTTMVFNRTGQLLFAKNDPVASEVYKALMKSIEMKEKVQQ